ncbi:MAG: hypothetical protein NTV03_03875 [Candidatus Nomurabacteria bacterium]|nr:hypothetical protein [Candidatus Nomurabacteria bacterium]
MEEELIKKVIEDIFTHTNCTISKYEVSLENGMLWQKKRFDSLKNIAHMMAERAKYFKSNIEVDPMPANERRIIHMFLEGIPDIKTESEGYGPSRRVVIKYTGNN